MTISTRVVTVDPDAPDPSTIAEAAAILRSGGLVAFATETVYGLGADATNAEAVARIFEAKGRPSTNPLIVHVVDQEQARGCVSHWPGTAETLANRFWPGPLTLVLPRSPIIPDLVTAGLDHVGVRIPRSNLALALIRATGRPIAAPSANRSTGISPTMAGHVLKDLEGRVELILDGGRSDVGLESTVVHLGEATPRVLRPGAITEVQLAEALGLAVSSTLEQISRDRPADSPGQQAIHYAPRTPTFWLESHQAVEVPSNQSFAIIGLGSEPRPLPTSDHRPTLCLIEAQPESVATRLYEFLHACDDHHLDLIFILPPPDLPEWNAIRDRLRRASRPWDAHRLF